jgi:hypothetical protein
MSSQILFDEKLEINIDSIARDPVRSVRKQQQRLELTEERIAGERDPHTIRWKAPLTSRKCDLPARHWQELCY